MMSLLARYRVLIGLVVGLAIAGYCGWLVYTDAPSYRLLVRLYDDKHFLKQTLRDWGILAPVLFMLLQALQVVISPIPGEATGFLGGYLFGEWLGLFYSTIGLTLGSVIAFWVGRWLGVHYVRNLVSKETWNKLGFIVEAEGAILCFIIYLIPGLPKDIICYLFGISPMPLWVFALVSGLGRVPGTWWLSASGAHTATGDYRLLILISAICAGVGLPLYYYRHRLIAWLQGRATPRVGTRPDSTGTSGGPPSGPSAPRGGAFDSFSPRLGEGQGEGGGRPGKER
jgi:uncharacterized membrane protein YdjX (TVP38/TMEM64 family)